MTEYRNHGIRNNVDLCVCVRVCANMCFPPFSFSDKHLHTHKTRLCASTLIPLIWTTYFPNTLQSTSFPLHLLFPLCLLSNAVFSLSHLRWLPDQTSPHWDLTQTGWAPLRDERQGHFGIIECLRVKLAKPQYCENNTKVFLGSRHSTLNNSAVYFIACRLPLWIRYKTLLLVS